jgi:hypothetical protein
MLRLEEKMEMQRPPSGINDGEPTIFVTTAKAPIKLRKRAFVEVAFRAARPSQDLFELGEILGIDLVRTMINPALVSRSDGLSVPTTRAFEKNRGTGGISEKFNGVRAKFFDRFSASAEFVSTISETGR